MLSVQEISAHIEIRQALYRYCRGVDRGIGPLIKSVYHPETIDGHGPWRGQGENFVASIVELMDGQDGPAQHHITNVLIDLDGDSARVESYYLAQFRDKDDEKELMVFAGGRFLDLFERKSGEWRITSRDVVMDWSRAEPLGERWAQQQLFNSGLRRGADASAEFFGYQL